MGRLACYKLVRAASQSSPERGAPSRMIGYGDLRVEQLLVTLLAHIQMKIYCNVQDKLKPKISERLNVLMKYDKMCHCENNIMLQAIWRS
ncbi:unnamed protein product, partial [Brenthis ino]